MKTSTLVLTAAALLNAELLNDEAFGGYDDSQECLNRLLTELWDLVYAHEEPLYDPHLLVEAWYEVYSVELEALCAG